METVAKILIIVMMIMSPILFSICGYGLINIIKLESEEENKDNTIITLLIAIIGIVILANVVVELGLATTLKDVMSKAVK